MPLSISPFTPPHHQVFNKMLEFMPDTSFILKAPIILPFSDSQKTTFTVTANAGDVITVLINNKIKTRVVAATEKFTFELQLEQGRNFIQVRTESERFEILVAATAYATMNMAWAEQFYNESWIKVEEHYLQLTSRFSLKQIEHQIVWQDLLPATRMHRILAGRMAVKSLMTMGGTDEGVTDIAKAITGNTPIVLPTLLDMNEYEPEAKLLYSSAHDFGGNEFNIWLLNLCATSWQAFIILMNNLDDDLFKLLSVTDRKVVVQEQTGEVVTHNFDFQQDCYCSIVSLLTQFNDALGACRVWATLTLTNSHSICMYQYPLDLAVDQPIGNLHFDTGTPLDNVSYFDSCDDSDPFCDGLLGLPIGCRFDKGNFWDSMNQQVISGTEADPKEHCMFFEPCASTAATTLVTPKPAHITTGVWASLEIIL